MTRGGGDAGSEGIVSDESGREFELKTCTRGGSHGGAAEPRNDANFGVGTLANLRRQCPVNSSITIQCSVSMGTMIASIEMEVKTRGHGINILANSFSARVNARGPYRQPRSDQIGVTVSHEQMIVFEPERHIA